MEESLFLMSQPQLSFLSPHQVDLDFQGSYASLLVYLVLVWRSKQRNGLLMSFPPISPFFSGLFL